MRKLIALILSWVVPATTVWATSPPIGAGARPKVQVAQRGPGLPSRVAPATSVRTSSPPDMAEARPEAHAPQSGPDLPSFGVLVGQVISDATGLAVPGATVELAGSPDSTQPVDDEGRFGLPASVGAHVLVAEKEGFVPVERSATSVAGQGTAVFDARLTPLGVPTTIGGSGGTASAGGVTVTIGAQSEATGFIVTLLSAQGLPNRLPLGFAPVLAFDLRAGRPAGGPFAVRLSGLPSTAAVHLVEYRPTEHAWFLTDDSLSVSEGIANSSLPGLGAYAVVTLDEDGPALPGPGSPLAGTPPVPLPAGVTGTASVEPIRVPATGATARGHLTAGPSDLPSGTLMQARLTETFTLGSVRIEDEPRLQDVVAYRAQPGSARTLKATIPLTAVRTFGSAEPVTGRLKLEFWTGRQSLAGSVGGGTEAVTVESGPARLVVPAGSLTTDTAVSIQSVPLSAFLPVAPGVTALGEVVVDLSGAVLSQSAELSLASSAGGTLVIARVERLAGVPYLTVVALAESQAGRIVSTSYPDLPGIVRGGRYVFYRVDGSLGFVAGTTTSPTGPVRAVVSTAGLPFVGVSSGSGAYITATTPGPAVEVTARVPRTPHQAVATVTVTAGQTTAQDLSLTAGLTTAEVLPADGATGVAVTVSLQLTASQPLDEATITATSIRLIKGDPDSGPTVTTRRQLSADGKTLSIVPESALEPATVYVLRVAGLKDAYAGPVNVADVHFTTRADVTPEYDLDKLKFSFPNAERVVTVTAVPGSFPPGTTVMVVNDSTAAVLTMTVDNEGGISGVGNELIATLDDVMVVSLSDSLGNTFTERRSKYVDVATGRVAIGSMGGVVEGTGGVELRLPEGAVDRGVVFKADLVNPASLPLEQRPNLGEGTVASAIRVEAPSRPSFQREVDLVFPKPADAPPGAFYYVVRQLAGPEGRAFFQTVDTAAVEGDKVVTNSPPFPGYDGSLGGLSYGGVGTVQLFATATNTVFLVWFFDQLIPSRPQMGVIHGRVTRNQWNAGTRQWEYVPVEGAIVRRLVDDGDPLRSPAPGTTAATTLHDGTYVLFDALYQGGFVMVRATDPETGREVDAPGYGLDQADRPLWARPYRGVALANVALTSVAPTPRMTVRLLEQSGLTWEVSDGLVAEGQLIAIGVSVANAAATIGSLEATLDGTLLPFREGGDEDLGFPWVAQAIAANRGASTASITFQPPAGGPITETLTFLVIGEGGDNNQILPDRAPEVILPRLLPQPGATAVSPGIYPEVAFTEPVSNLPEQVTLHELGEDGSEGPPLEIEMYGTGPQGVVTAAGFTAESQVSVLTVRPEAGLKYLTRYRLKLSGAIHDLDSGQAGDPKELEPFRLDFETFRSGVVGGSGETFLSAGIVVMEDRAWLVRNQFLGGILHTFDISDPVEPKEVPGTAVGIAGRPVDMAGEESAAIPGVRRLLVVGQTVTSQSRPSNLHVFDVSQDHPRRIGAATLSRTATEGTLSRVEVKGRHAYAITWRKGVLVVDLLEAKQNFDEEVAGSGNTLRMDDLLARNGYGFGHDAVVQTIPLFKPQSLSQWLLMDLKVGDYVYGGQTQTLVFVAGELSFALVNPQTNDWTIPASLQVGANRLTFGYALALGRLDNKDLAIVVGTGQANHPLTGVSTQGPVLAVVDLGEILNPSSPPGPKVLSVIPLFGGAFELASSPTDVILKEHLVVVASDRNAILVDLSNLAQPQITGQIEGIGGRLAAGEGSLIFGSAYSVTAGQSELGGIRSASTGRIAIVTGHEPDPIIVSAANEVFRDVDLGYKVLPSDPEVSSGTVEIAVRGGSIVTSLPALVNPAGIGSVTWPQGTIVNPLEAYDARLKVVKDGQPLPSAPKRLRFATVPVAITTRDRMLRIQFALPQQGLFTEKHYTVKVYLAAQGEDFPASPSFFVRSPEMQTAYPNVDVWWDDLRVGSPRAEASWVTRKLDRMDLPPGTDTTIRRQAFEIGTVLAGYPKVKVVVVSDVDGRELRVQEGVVTADGEWSTVLETINDRIRAAAGDLVPAEPILPAPGYFNPANIFGRLRALNYRCVLILDNYEIVTQGGFLKGLIDGFWAGVEGDKDTVVMLGTAFTQNPVTTAKAFGDFIKEVFTAFPGPEDFLRLVRGLYDDIRFPRLDETVMWAGEGYYWSGYLIGFVAEQAVVTIALMYATAGIGAVLKLAMNALKGVGWIGTLTQRTAVLIRSVGYMLQASKRAGQMRDSAKIALSFARDSQQALLAFFQKYERVDRILDRLTAAVRVSRVAAGRAIHWLTIVDRMSEEAAMRFVVFFERRVQRMAEAEAWLTRWTGLPDGNRAVKEAFEATNRAGEMADGAHDALVLTGTIEHPVPTLTYPKAFAERYGDRLESALRRLRDSADDRRFSDGVIGQTVRDLSAPGKPRLSDDAVEGAARSMLTDCVF